MLLHGRAPGSLAAAAVVAAAASRMRRIADKVTRGAPMGPREDPGHAPVVPMMYCYRAFREIDRDHRCFVVGDYW